MTAQPTTIDGMSSITLPANASRPKVHRLPPASLYVAPKKRRPVRLVVAGTTLLVLGVGSFLGSKQPAEIINGNTQHAAMLPAISVGPEATEDLSIIRNATNALSHTIGDAQAASAGKANKVITLHNNSDTIVGQMAKIPSQNESITEVKPANEVDKQGSRDLFSIVNKY